MACAGEGAGEDVGDAYVNAYTNTRLATNATAVTIPRTHPVVKLRFGAMNPAATTTITERVAKTTWGVFLPRLMYALTPRAKAIRAGGHSMA